MGCVFDVGGNTGVDVVASFDAWQDAKQKGDQDKNLESMDEKSKFSEYYESRLEKSILFGLFPIRNNTLREIYFGRDFDLCSEGVMKFPGG